jgi:hypothetical protein
MLEPTIGRELGDEVRVVVDRGAGRPSRRRPTRGSTARRLVALPLVDTRRHDARVGAEAHGVPEEPRGIKGSPIVDSMKRAEVALDVVEVVEYPSKLSGPF